MTSLPLLLALAVAPAVDEQEPAPRDWQVEAGGSGRVGAQAGHFLNVPWAFALPGGGIDAKLRRRFGEHFYGQAEASFSLGVGETGDLGGGYWAYASLGWIVFDFDWVDLDARAFAGLSSVSLIPVPGFGGRTKLTFTPVRLQHFEWELGGELGLEILIIVPRPFVGVNTAFIVPLGDVRIGLDVSAGAEAIIAVIANVVGAKANARLFVSWAF